MKDAALPVKPAISQSPPLLLSCDACIRGKGLRVGKFTSSGSSSHSLSHTVKGEQSSQQAINEAQVTCMPAAAHVRRESPISLTACSRTPRSGTGSIRCAIIRISEFLGREGVVALLSCSLTPACKHKQHKKKQKAIRWSSLIHIHMHWYITHTHVRTMDTYDTSCYRYPPDDDGDKEEEEDQEPYFSCKP